MRYIGCTRRTRKTDAHRTLKYVLIILACRALYPPNSFHTFLTPPLYIEETLCVSLPPPRLQFLRFRGLQTIQFRAIPPYADRGGEGGAAVAARYA